MSYPSTLADLEMNHSTMNTKWIRCPEKWTYVPETDLHKDKCIALYSYSDWRLQPSTWQRLLQWFRPLLSSGILYSVNPQDSEGGRLHFTLHQCTGFGKEHRLDAERIQAVSPSILDFLKEINGLEIEFRGLLITPTGIALRGHPKDGIQLSNLMNTRSKLSTFLPSIGLPFSPPYTNDICHATLFRWTSQPTQEQIDYIQETAVSWNEAHIATFTPTEWCLGLGTLAMRKPHVEDGVTLSTPLRIAHRGLTNGPDNSLENSLERLQERCAKGLYSECDLWYIDSKLYLGHDTPVREICFGDISSPYLWLHAKNKLAFEYLLHKRNHEGYTLCIFWHTTEDYAISTTGEIIVYPGKELLDGSTFMMPEHSGNISVTNAIRAVCSDY